MREFPAEEVRGFESPIAHRHLAQILEECVRAGTAIAVAADPAYAAGDVGGGQWFKDATTGRIWRLVGPAEPYPGVWEQVYVA